MLYSELAQKAIDQIISTMRQQWNLDVVIDGALKNMVEWTNSDRAVALITFGPEMNVRNAYSKKSTPEVLGHSLNLMDTASLTLNVLSHLGGRLPYYSQQNGGNTDYLECFF